MMRGVSAALLVLASLLTATISGFLGMAGGMALLAVMTALLPAPVVVPLHGIVQLSSNSTRSLLHLSRVAWPIFAVYAPALVVGVFLASRLYAGISMTWFKPAIGVFLLVFLAWRRWAPKLRNLPRWTYAPLGLVTGFLTIFVGATGPFIAPFFLRDDLSKEEVIATKAVCQTVGHLLKIPVFLSVGFDYLPHAGLLGAMIGATIVGTAIGGWILKRMSPRVFLLVFESVLGLLAVHLVLEAMLR